MDLTGQFYSVLNNSDVKDWIGALGKRMVRIGETIKYHEVIQEFLALIEAQK
jgi:hypothetical protein